MNPFIYSNDNKRYHTYNFYLKQHFHQKVAKVSLNAGLSCPHRDPMTGLGGCIYCSNEASGDFGGDKTQSLQAQFETGKAIMQRKWPNCAFIAYFQAGTNTYAPLEKLKEMFEPFINREDVAGIALATRPDCLPDDVINYLTDVNQRCELTVELGLQTIHEKTSKLIHRGHDLNCFITAINKLRAHNIKICVHIINGLPYETEEDMLATARFVSQLDIQFLKIHMLFILDNTPLYTLYKKHPFPLLSREDYIAIVVKQLALQKEETVIERLTGDGDPKHLFYPLWSIKKVTILNDIDKAMVRLNTWQGKTYGNEKALD